MAKIFLKTVVDTGFAGAKHEERFELGDGETKELIDEDACSSIIDEYVEAGISNYIEGSGWFENEDGESISFEDVLKMLGR